MDPRQDVSTFRLYVLRAVYLLIFAGLALQIWPLIVRPPQDLQLMRGVVWSVLTAVSLLAALGIRHPLRMLPLLFFEFLWKAIWMLAIGLPRRAAGPMDAATTDTFFAVLLGIVVVPLALPWRYVWENYVRAPADRWGRGRGDESRNSPRG
jgi:hypothetical protein